MKYVLFFCILFIASCSVPKFSKVPAEHPFLTIKKGKTINAEYVERLTSKSNGTRLMADDNLYLPKTVSFYSDGINTFANIKDTQFAKKVVAGKINLYTANLNSYGRPASSKPLFYYLQKGKADDLLPFSYSTIHASIPEHNQGMRYLKRYKTLNYISTLMSVVGLAITATGVYQIGEDKAGKPGLPQNPSGVAIAAGGLWTFIAAAIVKEENKVNLFRAVKKYNTEK